MNATETNPTCVLCKKTCNNAYGNNPWPLASEGVCCDECNQKKVILARVGMHLLDRQIDNLRR